MHPALWGCVPLPRDPHSPGGVLIELGFGAISTGVGGASPVLGVRLLLFLMVNLKPKAMSCWWCYRPSGGQLPDHLL